MKKISRSNYKQSTPEQIVSERIAGTAGIIETSLLALAEIIGYIFQAVQSRRMLKKKVEAMEVVLEKLVESNKMLAEELQILKDKNHFN